MSAERRHDEVERLRDLIRRLLPGWGSDEAGCDPDNYAAYKEAASLLGKTA